jgi:hypothetical protein
VENTVARGQLHRGRVLLDRTGPDGKEGNAMPFPVTMEVLERGQERFNIYCTPCHSRVGNGAGMIVQRGYRPAGNFHTPRLMAAPLGHFFNVMTNGYGAMPDYKAQVAPQDRWAIVAYIKALQLSQDAKPADAEPGAQIESLANIAASEGLPASFGNELGAAADRDLRHAEQPGQRHSRRRCLQAPTESIRRRSNRRRQLRRLRTSRPVFSDHIF